MTMGYMASGGLASGDHVARLLRDRHEQPVSLLARAIVARRIVSLEWRQERLLPLFQFDMQDMPFHRETLQVVRELRDVFDDWEMALWFARPNAWVQGEIPASLIRLHPRAVFEAARTDRYIARG